MHTDRLIQINTRWLQQALELLDVIDDRVYATAPAGFAPHKAGAHLRHILEFYECLLDATGRVVDYDARKRDVTVETSREAAAARIRSLMKRLQNLLFADPNCALLVRAEDSNDFVGSTLTRELASLSSHTIHHFALIAMTLRAHGVTLHPDFGMAPSTLRYLAQKEAA
jgi:hypothetical protein